MTITMSRRALGTLMTMSMLMGCADQADTGSDSVEPQSAPAGAADNALASAPSGAASEVSKDIVLCPQRSDRSSTVTVTGGNWGTWDSCARYCPEGSFAYGLSLKSEASVGIDDDTALNGIKLNCNNRTSGAWTANVTSSIGAWGSWQAVAMCPSIDAPLSSGNMLLESSKGIGDDTSANRIQTTCTNGTVVTPAAQTNWGTWRGKVSCPVGTGVCGLRTRVEASQGADDDTALNGLQFECCVLCPVGQVACGANEQCLAPAACPPPPVVK